MTDPSYCKVSILWRSGWSSGRWILSFVRSNSWIINSGELPTHKIRNEQPVNAMQIYTILVCMVLRVDEFDCICHVDASRFGDGVVRVHVLGGSSEIAAREDIKVIYR